MYWKQIKNDCQTITAGHTTNFPEPSATNGSERVSEGRTTSQEMGRRRRQQRSHEQRDLALCGTTRQDMGLHGKRLCEQRIHTANKTHAPDRHENAKASANGQTTHTTTVPTTTTTTHHSSSPDFAKTDPPDDEGNNKSTKSTNSVLATLFTLSETPILSAGTGSLPPSGTEVCRGNTKTTFF